MILPFACLPLEFIGDGEGPFPWNPRIFFLCYRFEAFLSLLVMFRYGNESFSKLEMEEGATCA